MPAFTQFTSVEKSCLSYYVTCPGSGKAAVIDPGFDVSNYLEKSGEEFTEIVAVIDTHIHADHISGARKLAKLSGAPLFMHERAKVKFDFAPLREGTKIEVGNATLEAWFTPGHTPESVSLLYYDKKRGSSPWCVFTGDTLFVGDIGRLDLIGAGTPEQMYDSLFNRLLSLEDYVEIYPGHYLGSVCGSDMSLKTVSTIGFEKRFNRALRASSLDEFKTFLNQNKPTPFPEHLKIKKENMGEEKEEKESLEIAS